MFLEAIATNRFHYCIQSYSGGSDFSLILSSLVWVNVVVCGGSVWRLSGGSTERDLLCCTHKYTHTGREWMVVQ